MAGLRDSEGRLLRTLQPYARHGAEFIREVGTNQALAYCPFCGKDKFYVNKMNGLFDCKSKECTGERQGNVQNFLEQLAKYNFQDTAPTDYARLGRLRSIDPWVFRDAEIGWTGEHWLVPIRGANGKLQDLRIWRERGKLSTTPGATAGLFGAERLARADAKEWVWLCEGEWDALALRAALKKAGRPGIAVAVPGAGIFKKEWPDWLKGHRVRLCYDADEAGDQGMAKASRMLRSKARELQFLNWPENLPTGFDVRDFFSQKNAKFALFEEMFKPKPRRVDTADPAEADPAHHEAEPADEPGHTRTWKQVLNAYREHFKMTGEVEGAIKVSFATVATLWMGGDPLWLFLVAPPGGMKTEIVMAFQDSAWCVFKSAISSRALVSGFKCANDPSLLPKLIGKTFVLKDYTEIKSMHPAAQEEIFSTLRGAYDGVVDRSFGNDLDRHYDGVYFHMIAAVTPIIHGDKQASLGERFLKYVLVKSTLENADEAVGAAFDNVGREEGIKTRLRQAVKSFIAELHKRWEKRKGRLPAYSEGFRSRTIALAQLLGMLRANVERDWRAGDQLLYRPQYEVGTRPGKQLFKMAIGLSFVDDDEEISRENEDLMRKVAFDTARGFHIDIFQALAENEKGLLTSQLQEQLNIPTSTLRPRLEDLEALEVVRHDKNYEETGAGRKEYRWHLTGRAAELWHRANDFSGEPQRPSKLKARRRRK